MPNVDWMHWMFINDNYIRHELSSYKWMWQQEKLQVMP